MAIEGHGLDLLAKCLSKLRAADKGGIVGIVSCLTVNLMIIC